ncbi:M15 family metallopeptidase [Alloscardovia macacae]|uniref:Serine-type D-Ala-D-Ala carboxypeptidase n=1 Tax=Alloscardovia macacae TaxID=1160091 RepID=A0A261F4Q0_9BIFI|nr:M15 family metallopeptidase [Alloscardovia macacae]OZG53896.1 serine-type D-Ala-D-Ala carboxypeptidase [Alloscardovia macacae]
MRKRAWVVSVAAACTAVLCVLGAIFLLPSVHVSRETSVAKAAAPAPVPAQAEPVTPTPPTLGEQLGLTASDWRLVLVNREHITPEMNPQVTVINNRCSVDSRIAADLDAFLAAAQQVAPAAHLISCYRSVAYQTNLFEMYVQQELEAHPGWTRDQAETQVKTYSQPAGASEHQTGLAVDLSTIEHLNEQPEATARAIQSLAPQYGFILRFPQGKVESTGVEYEDWHFRFVGHEAAQYITQNGLSLEEFLDRLEKKM